MSAPAPRKGRITGSYLTRSGETVWIVAWADRAAAPMVDVQADPGLRVGQHVRLVRDRLEAC